MFNEGLMIKRHDHLVQKIGKKLRKVNINRKIWIECALGVDVNCYGQI